MSIPVTIPRVAVSALLAGLLAAGSSTSLAQDYQPLSCDLQAYQSSSNIQVVQAGDLLSVTWSGSERQQLQMQLGLVNGEPRLRELALRNGRGPWSELLAHGRFEFHIVEGLRRISNQQLVPLRELGVELTPEVVDRYKWDVFWDAPLDLRTEVGGGNPPPAAGVANQPGLPRSPGEISRAAVRYDSRTCTVHSDGARVGIHFPGLQLGSFTGELVLTVYENSNLIRIEAVAATRRPSVAYKYDVGLSGLPVQAAAVRWNDTAGQAQAYGLRGPVNEDIVPLTAANRVVVAQLRNGAVAAFPPPHTFFWAREVEINVGYNWYRKDSSDAFAIGIRQGEQEVVERYLANWSLYSAPPGSQQHMAAYFYPTVEEADAAFEDVLAFTHGDVYKPLPGYQVMGSHYHTNMGRELLNSGSVDTRLRDFEVLRSAGINIAGPVDRPAEASQLEELHYLFEGALRHSDGQFMVLPQMENSNLLGGHWDLLFSHPVYYVDARPPGTPLVTQHPVYGKQYNIGSVADIMAMVEAENMLIFMPHPRTKGSTGYPDAVADTPQFLNDRYRGVGWRWGMGSDLSEKRLSDYRVIPLLDEMNNWITGSGLRPKYLLAITETYFKAPGDDIYANGPVSYLQLDELPTGNDYSSIIEVLNNGNYFVTSGEVLVPDHEVTGNGRDAVLHADVTWTFPLDFVEVVYGDGQRTGSVRLSTTQLPPFGAETFHIPFDATGQSWVRFAAWDSAGNGAMTMPLTLEP
ncbi:MAG: hypothetical protein RLZZ385_1341 [Pseudomonadota bacterium]|jgi:hypothetical protein